MLNPLEVADNYIDVSFQWLGDDTSKTVPAHSGITLSMTSKVGNDDLTGYKPCSLLKYIISGTYNCATRGFVINSNGTGGYLYVINTTSNDVIINKSSVEFIVRFKKI